MHWPRVAARLQDLHDSEHAKLQHTPWAQNPDLHSLPALQSAPSGFFPQEVFTQVLGATQSASLVHALKQTLPLQANGLQPRGSGDVHWRF